MVLWDSQFHFWALELIPFLNSISCILQDSEVGQTLKSATLPRYICSKLTLRKIYILSVADFILLRIVIILFSKFCILGNRHLRIQNQFQFTFSRIFAAVDTIRWRYDWQRWRGFKTSTLNLWWREVLVAWEWVAWPWHTGIADGRPGMESIQTGQMLPLAFYHCVLCCSLCCFVPKNAIYGADAWSVLAITDAFFNQAVANFPGKNSRVLLLVLHNFVDDWRRGYFRLASTNGTWSNRASFVVSPQNLAYTAVRDKQPTRNFTRPNATGCQLYDSMTNVIRKWSTIDKRASKLIDSAMTLKEERCWKKRNV